MGKRQDIAKKGLIVRYLIDENKYIEALEVIDELDLNEVESTADLNLFADLYEKAERFDKKKEIYYIIYRRNHSRHVLNRLLRLVLRMGDMEEARELFLTYEMAGGVTLDTYELRYLLARAEGASRKVLIDILEELKREEYTEEWGYQLAQLYEQEGLREECIAECKDLILWFGSGAIIDKARELLARVEEPDWQQPQDEEIPEPEVNEEPEMIPYAANPIEVKELSDDDEDDDDDEEDEEEEDLIEDESVAGESDLPDVDEFAEEVEGDNPSEEAESSEEDMDEEEPDIPEDNEDVETSEEDVPEEMPEEKAPKKSAFQRFKDFFRADDLFEELEVPAEPGIIIDDSVKDLPLDAEVDVEVADKEDSEEEQNEPEKAAVEESSPVEEISAEDEIAASLEAKVSALEEEMVEEPSEPMQVEPDDDMEKRLEVSEPTAPIQMEVEEKKVETAEAMEVEEQEKAEQLEVVTPVEPEDISEKGISYRTLKGTMRHLNQHEGPAHFAFAGGEERITLAIAKRMTKELNKIGYFSAGSINRISADMLNQIDLLDQTEKLLGGCTLITSAPELHQKSVNDLVSTMKKYGTQIAIMIAGPFDEMDCFLASYPELAELFDFKVRM